MRILGIVWIYLLFFQISAVSAGLDPISEAEDRRLASSGVLEEGFSSKDPKIRLRVAQAFGRIQNKLCVEPLLLLVEDSVTNVRVEAIFALGQIAWDKAFLGSYQAQVLSALRKALGDSSVEVKRVALEALGKLAPDHLEVLISPFLHDRSALLQAEALLSLFRWKTSRWPYKMKQGSPLPESVIQKMIGLRKHKSALVRRNLVYYFARIRDKRGLIVIRELVQDKSVWVRMYAQMALRKQAEPKYFALAVNGTKDPKYFVRVAAVQALAAMKASLKLPKSIFQDPSYHVRLAVVKALSGAKDVPLKKLLSFGGDSSRTVRAAVLLAVIKKEGRASFSRMEEALADKDWVIREAAVKASKVLKKKQLAFLQEAFLDKDVRVRSAVLPMIAVIPGKLSFSVLQKALRSEHLSERGWAVEVLGKRAEKGLVEVAWKTYQESLDRRWIELRENLVRLLQKQKKVKARGYLNQMLRDPAPSVRRLAKKALSKLSRVSSTTSQPSSRASEETKPTSRTARGNAKKAPSSRSVKKVPSSRPAKKAPSSRSVKKVLSLKPTEANVLPLPKKAKLTFSPHRLLRFKKNPVLLILTNRGSMEVECYADVAPIHTANIVGLARKGFYDGLVWHRVISNFVIQGGDPDGTGWGDAGFSVRAEVNKRLFVRGALGMPRGMGWNTGGVQIFISHIPTPHLDGRYTVFGRVTAGLNVLDKIERGDKILKIIVKSDEKKSK